MFRNRSTRSIVAAVCIFCQPGCAALTKRHDYSALLEPASIRSPAPENRLVAKSKELTWRTMEVVGTAAALAAYLVLKMYSDDDD